MNILICIKQVPNSTDIKVDPKTNSLIRDGIESVINPLDKNALEMGLQLKEEHGGKVSVITMGPPQAKSALKECYAMGADEMILVTDRAFGGADTLATSYTLSALIRQLNEFDVILCGQHSSDGDTAQVGPEIAEHLGMAQITSVVDAKIDDFGKVIAQRKQKDCYEIIETKLPILMTVMKVNEPRYPNIMRKKQADKVEIQTYKADNISNLNVTKIGLSGSPTEVTDSFIPQVTSKGIKIEAENTFLAVEELVKHLQNAGIKL